EREQCDVDDRARRHRDDPDAQLLRQAAGRDCHDLLGRSDDGHDLRPLHGIGDRATADAVVRAAHRRAALRHNVLATGVTLANAAESLAYMTLPSPPARTQKRTVHTAYEARPKAGIVPLAARRAAGGGRRLDISPPPLHRADRTPPRNSLPIARAHVYPPTGR